MGRTLNSEEIALEHRKHIGFVEDCPYCARRLRGMSEDVPTRVADFCLVHGLENCDRPDCYACGNHELDEHDRCGDARCGALNSPAIVELLADLGTAPIELKRYMVGKYLAESLERMGTFPP